MSQNTSEERKNKDIVKLFKRDESIQLFNIDVHGQEDQVTVESKDDDTLGQQENKLDLRLPSIHKNGSDRRPSIARDISLIDGMQQIQLNTSRVNDVSFETLDQEDLRQHGQTFDQSCLMTNTKIGEYSKLSRHRKNQITINDIQDS